MTEDQSPQPARGSEWWGQFLVFFIALAALLLVLISNAGTTAGDSASPDTVNVFFQEPANNATVSSRFTVVMRADGLTVEPSGEVREGAGHFHIMVDEDFIEPGEIIPNDETHLHFGDGSSSATIELSPGTHTLRLQFADGAHMALEGEQYRDEIIITVEE